MTSILAHGSYFRLIFAPIPSECHSKAIGVQFRFDTIYAQSRPRQCIEPRWTEHTYRNAMARPARATPNQHMSDKEAASLPNPEP
jgi:hypothetical protein